MAANADPLKVFDNPTILNEVRLKEELAKFNVPFPADSKRSVCRASFAVSCVACIQAI